MKIYLRVFYVLTVMVLFSGISLANEFPDLPDKNSNVEIPAQEWYVKPGPRTIKVYLHYPGENVGNVNSQTGLMLDLHNWGGTYHSGTADPQRIADRFNVITICVDYLQSGKQWKKHPPYDFGYLQSLDALRSLYYVFNGLKQKEIPFASDRIYCTGGSGGGNVTLMANKFAPRTFACSIDNCGMAKLSDDIAFGLPDGSFLNAQFSKDKEKINYLSPDRQQLHFVGDPEHLQVMKNLGNQNKLIVVHGTTDKACPFKDAREMVENFRSAKLDVESYFLGKAELDGHVFKSTGHSLGDRTLIVFKVGDPYLLSDGEKAKRLTGPTDFERKEVIKYPTENGTYEISYEKGYPVGRFVPKSR